MTTNQPGDINTAINDYLSRAQWRQQLVTDHDTAAQRLLQSYQRLIPRMQGAADAFNQRLNDYVAANNGETPPAGQVRHWGEYQRLRDSIETEMSAFSAILDNEAATVASSAADAGIVAAQDLVSASGGQVIAGALNRPDPLAIARAAGYADSPAFQANVAAFGQNAADNFGDVIIAGIAQGKNPAAIASIASNWLSIPYSWALNTVTTTQLWSYRTASHETYRANADVVQGWMWWSSRDVRTCLACLQQHGSIHPLSEHLDGHHRCRCTPLPMVIGSTWQNTVQTGAQWFDAQPEATQREIMGAGRYELYTGGMWDWNRASTTYENNVFGTMRRESTLREMSA